ncbi:uncharacterized protein LOC122384688 [Amphibalanus amphitrite]|uniref:uncharacterized protein LOC122384688 n=1 Tax=Amphibalanus amphitrite TaxID=1232801 RepID=UPI001C91F041|nr:uncharacterized protein LOC122384688 [Amphibalanus amphitrite]
MPEYHYDQLGTVAELYPLHKAVLTFQLNGRGPEQRALLWGRRFVCPNGLPLAEDESIDDVLCINDQVLFDCHIYDNENNQDRCGWYVARAESARRPEQLSSVVSNAMGTVVEVGPRRAFVEFRQPGRVELQRAVFVAARFFDHGGRLPAGTSLRSCVYEDQKLHLDAQHRPGQLQGASWYAWLAWRGQRPEVELDREPPAEVLAGEEEPPTQRPTATLADNLLPALSSAESRAQAQRRHQDKWGYVSSLLDAEYGVLLWQVAPRQYQSVLFHRSAAHLFDLNLKNYDLRTVFKKGDHLRFEAEKAEPSEPYKWKAYSVWLEEA